jgi:hypothetical protein
MKTNFYLPTLLAAIIQVMVSGQTQDNQITQIRKTLISNESAVVNVTYSIRSNSINLLDLVKET